MGSHGSCRPSHHAYVCCSEGGSLKQWFLWCCGTGNAKPDDFPSHITQIQSSLGWLAGCGCTSQDALGRKPCLETGLQPLLDLCGLISAPQAEVFSAYGEHAQGCSLLLVDWKLGKKKLPRAVPPRTCNWNGGTTQQPCFWG